MGDTCNLLEHPFVARVNPKTGLHEIIDTATGAALSMQDIANLLNTKCKCKCKEGK